PEETPEITKETEKEEHTKITPTKPEETPEITKETEKEEHTKITPTKPEETPEITKETEKEEHTKRPLNREEVMKKYGLADVDEEEVERVLETYKGGAMTTIDTEKVELTLMNKIKKSIIGIPNIKNVEVMVFLENVPELEGDIKVLIERESKGLLSRLIGGVMKEEELKEHIYDIIEMEIKKTFRGYPEIIEKFSVNIEIH
ncbi:MAG: DUF2226 domain-containing protein, partial [Methanobacteriales archaeon]|nr:DUF2226 domain-containing protein [Methanobacteriales archaeon]